MEKAKQIATLNDRLRKEGIGGRIMLTQSILALEAETRRALFQAIRTFDTFTPDNDPHKERDFGAVTVEGEKYFFKVDYYDNSLKFGSEDPSDPSITERVMTIMHASEY